MQNKSHSQIKCSYGDQLPTLQSDRNKPYNYGSVNLIRLKTGNVNPSETNLRSPEDGLNPDDLVLREYFTQAKLKRQITFEQVAQEELNNFSIRWSWSFFCEFLFYHIIFYIFLGPFMVVLFWKYPGMPLMINMRFLKHHPQFYFQLLLWLGSAVGGVFYFFIDDSLITLTEIMFMWFALLIRSVVIAAKYATLSYERIKLYKAAVLSEEMFTFDLMMWDWRMQTPKALFIEQLRFLKRREFDHEAYKIDFLVEPAQKTIRGIKNANVGFYKEWLKNQEQDIEPIENGVYNGFYVMAYLISIYQKQSTPGSFSKYVVVQALVISLTPILLRIDFFQSLDITWLDITRLVINILTSFQAFFGAFVFLQIGLYDFQRKFFLLDQCLYMLSAKEVPIASSKKWIPTINFNNPATVRAWSMMRGLAFEYGKTYDLRIQGFYSLIFIGWFLLFVGALAILLELVQIEEFSLILLAEMLVILTAFLGYYLYHGAKLNAYYDKCEIVLEQVMKMYKDILQKKNEYFLLKQDPSNCVHKKFIKLIQKQVDDIDSIAEYINLVIAEVEEAIHQLRYDEKHHPFMVYGIAVSYNFLKQVGFGISTIMGFVLQQRFSANDIKCLV